MTKTLVEELRANASETAQGWSDNLMLSAASRIEELERALKIAEHDLTTTHNLRATDLSPYQMNEALNRGVALSDLEWMTDNSRGLEAARQALPSLIGGGGVPAGWQPIETAPKDTWILLANGKVVSSGRFRKHDVFRLYGFIRDGAEMPDESITHWMPLPDAPASTVEG